MIPTPAHASIQPQFSFSHTPTHTMTTPTNARPKLADLAAFGTQVLEILADHQNVGTSHKSVTFADPGEGFLTIAKLAAQLELITVNPDNGLLIPRVNDVVFAD